MAFEDMSYIPNFISEYGSELGQIEVASQQAAATVNREMAKLTRSDGSRVYSDQEHNERVTAILAAGAQQYGGMF